jgi:hypothetical protein
MLPPGFEPGSHGRKPWMLGRTTLQEHKHLRKSDLFKVN